MSMDYVVLLAAVGESLTLSTLTAHAQLQKAGWKLGPSVTEAQLDPQRAVFDETDQELRRVADLGAIVTQISDWTGIALEYHHDQVGGIYVLWGGSSGFLNVWIEISEPTFRATVNTPARLILYRAITDLALAFGAECGVGDVELGREPRSPHLLRADLIRDGQMPEAPHTRLYLTNELDTERPAWSGANTTTFHGLHLIETRPFMYFWSTNK